MTDTTRLWRHHLAGRRTYTAAEKLRILREAERCPQGQLGALTTWRRERDRDQLTNLAARKRGPKVDELAQRLSANLKLLAKR